MLGSEENKVAVLFKLLKLHLTNGKVFQSPVYNKWITFVASRYADDNAAFAAMFPFLAKYLKGDELVKLLVSGLKLKKTKISATRRLKKETKKLIKSWVDSGKDEAYVFELLGLDSERKTNNIHLKNLWKSFVRAKQDKPSRE
ncbi:unnamed protein product [Peronospora effusa]|uniref:RXLR phytopathogen effector protein WY-domain domain-containing protein n=1 Tax=Peronospora effusa TaxID=542832 RepID=A0A3M6VR27_9STRA|nr:hypothetical protein DD238_005515 [Peronospora effusa]CAI5707061.1 unnamed protein product [Peronospora effusa]